ncbi:MAG: hypothetical protein JKX73_03345 [Flavobacteriales bacterium]|nr:hypothetical protein [Flavobacteriales bacterium]
MFALSFLSMGLGSSIAQLENTTYGAYRNSVDLKENKPLFTCQFEITAIKNKNKIDLYKVKPVGQKIKAKEMAYAIWAIYQRGKFYLNAQKLGMMKGFIKVEVVGKYSYFKGVPILSMAQKNQISEGTFMFGLIGAATSTSQVSKDNEGKEHYVLNLESGISNLLTPGYMLKMMKPHEDLQKQYEASENKSLREVLRFVDLVNEREKL